MAIETLTGDTSLVLPEFDDPPADPIALLRGWLDTAVTGGVREPYSMVLATADAAGMPSSRIVMVKGLEPAGIEFWHGSVDRLHRRLRYDHHPEGWTPQRLQP